jgi:isopenicillin N synthase-like dioxygenase
VPNPDPDAGLYIRGRDGSLIKAVVPPGARDVLLFQIGETAQVHTGGVLQATPHAVRGARGRAAEGVSRETFAVFMEPEFDGDMSLPEGRTIEDVQGGEAVKFLPPSVRTLGSRWKEGMDFGAFSEATFSTFYNVVGEEEE